MRQVKYPPSNLTHLANFEDAIETTNNEHLEVKLRSDAHEEIHIEIIVMCHKWLGRGATGDHVHHWRFNLQETKSGEIAADVLDELTTNNELLTDV